MIAALAGTLLERTPERLVVETRDGVGYLVHVSQQTFAELPPTGAAVRLLVHTEVREDAIDLIGFHDERERALFHLLRKVKGLGPLTSLAVLSGMPAQELAAVIGAGDVARLQAIPGVGKKLAERVVVECRSAAALLAGGHGPTTATVPSGDALADEAVSALVNLGYKRPEAERAVTKARTNGEGLASSEGLEGVIRAALKGLAG
jgi:Holliday junction DNA helicase RuvA